MTAPSAGEVVVVRLTFAPTYLHTGLDELRDLLMGSDPLRRNVTLRREPDGTETLGVQEVLEIALEVVGSNAGSNIVGGIFGGVVESAVALWLIARAQRRADRSQARVDRVTTDVTTAVDPGVTADVTTTGVTTTEQRAGPPPVEDLLLDGAGVRYVVGADGRIGLDVRLSDRPDINRAVLAAGLLLLRALGPDAVDGSSEPVRPG